MSRLIQPQVDPGRETRCTSLQRLLQDKSSAPRVATACLTPVYVRGRYVGAFGSSLDLKPFFARAVLQGFPGAESLIIRKDGQLLAAPGAAVADPRSVKRYQSQLDLTALAKDLVASKRAFGVMSSPNKKDIIAYGRLAAPGWYMLLRYPAAKIMGSAAVWASWILLLGLACAALQTMILLHLAASSVIRPLAALAQSCEAENHAVPDELLRRPDEIGVLAQSLKTERARSEELLASLEDRVQQRTAELEKANAEKSRFLANMSHELRTPLNGVIALSETLAQAQTSPRNIEVAELIVSSGRLLEQVLTDILDFSKIEAGEMRLEAHPFDLGVTVSGVAELHRAAAQAKGLELRWQMAQEAAGTYLGDPVRLTQVLSNLLSNAVKFTASGGVVLSVAAQDGGLAFSVADTGIGFPPSVRETLFQRFEQADLSIRRRFGGTGLGLAICRSLVGLMGGSIDAQSTPGQGSVFFFTIPLERAQPANAQPSDRQEGSSPSLDGVSVLLAEDHPTNQKIVQLILEASGVDLVTVENGRQALTAVELRPFDLILMDMQMPELDGLTATVLLRQREAAEGLRRTPVIMLTANALDEHRQASLEAGADQHLSKPIRANELLRAMNAVIAARDDRGRQSASA